MTRSSEESSDSHPLNPMNLLDVGLSADQANILYTMAINPYDKNNRDRLDQLYQATGATLKRTLFDNFKETSPTPDKILEFLGCSFPEPVLKVIGEQLSKHCELFTGFEFDKLSYNKTIEYVTDRFRRVRDVSRNLAQTLHRLYQQRQKQVHAPEHAARINQEIRENEQYLVKAFENYDYQAEYTIDFIINTETDLVKGSEDDTYFGRVGALEHESRRKCQMILTNSPCFNIASVNFRGTVHGNGWYVAGHIDGTKPYRNISYNNTKDQPESLPI